MILLTRPEGGTTWVHESRLDEYLGRGFKLPSPPPEMPAPANPPASKKRSTKK